MSTLKLIRHFRAFTSHWICPKTIQLPIKMSWIIADHSLLKGSKISKSSCGRKIEFHSCSCTGLMWDIVMKDLKHFQEITEPCGTVPSSVLFYFILFFYTGTCLRSSPPHPDPLIPERTEKIIFAITLVIRNGFSFCLFVFNYNS